MDDPSLPPAGNHAVGLHDVEVLTAGTGCDADKLSDLSDGQGSLADKFDYLEPVRVGKHAQDPCGAFQNIQRDRPVSDSL